MNFVKSDISNCEFLEKSRFFAPVCCAIENSDGHKSNFFSSRK